MRRLLAILVVLLAVSVGAFALAGADAPAVGGDASTDEPFPTATDDGGDTTGTPAASDQPFAVVIDDVQECGITCRDVTVSLTNQQDEAASDVVVYTRVFAGNSTAEGDRIWRGSETVGTLAAGETHTATRRVELSYSEAYAVEQADGWVTIQTTIETADRTVTFTERRNVN